MRSNWKVPIAAPCAALLLAAGGAWAQENPLPKDSISVNLPPTSPVSVISMSSDQSRATARGAAMVLDLDMNLTLRNASPNRIRGITLRVISQEAYMGGKGSVSKVGLNVGQGEVFPMVRIQMQLVRPSQVAGGPLVQVNLDGVLFQDLSFYGDNKLDSRRFLTAYEMEAQRDREHFKQVLAREGKEGLRKAMLESLARQRDLPALDVRVRRGNGAVVSAALPPEHDARFAFLQFPDSPVQPVDGSARIAGNEARAPQIDVRNNSSRPVQHVEFGWVVTDPAGRQYMAAALPSSDSPILLPPGSNASVRQDSSLRFSANGQPVNIQKMTGFVSQVEFVDGKVWVPSRQNLDNPLLQKVLQPSAEEQRLAALYVNKGPDALVEELKKF